MGCRGLQCSAAACALLALAAEVSAGSGIPILDESELEFEAPRGCPDAVSFLEQTNRRGQSSRPFRVDTAFRDVRVRIEKTETGAEGLLRIRESVSGFSERRVSASACEEVVTALALVTSVALEGEHPRDEADAVLVSAPGYDRGETHRPLRRGVVAAPRPARRSNTLRPRYSVRTPTSDTPPVAEPEAAESPASMVYDRESDAVTSFFGPRTPYGWWAIGAHGGMVAGALPETLPTAELFVDARFDPTQTWNPSFRLSAKRAVYEGGDSTQTWTSGRADACLVNVQLNPELALWPCATFHAALASGRTNPGLGFGGLARLQWIAFDVLLLEAQAGGSVGDASAGRNVAYTLHSSAGLGARFP